MYNVFISHSWSYFEQYQGIVSLLDRGGLEYRDYSVPKDDPIHTNGSDKELYEAIERKIKPCSCVIILAGVYASYSKWIDKEIEIAINYGKPIIAVEYWGAERTSAKVKNAADKIVKWQASSICKAVEDLA